MWNILYANRIECKAYPQDTRVSLPQAEPDQVLTQCCAPPDRPGTLVKAQIAAARFTISLSRFTCFNVVPDNDCARPHGTTSLPCK